MGTVRILWDRKVQLEIQANNPRRIIAYARESFRYKPNSVLQTKEGCRLEAG